MEEAGEFSIDSRLPQKAGEVNGRDLRHLGPMHLLTSQLIEHVQKRQLLIVESDEVHPQVAVITGGEPLRSLHLLVVFESQIIMPKY
jgi:hypothetical protein